MSQQQGRPIYIPPTTAKTVVFPLKTDYKLPLLNTYSTDFYSPDLTADQVSIQEINQFFSKIHSVFQSPLSGNSNRRPWLLLGFFFPIVMIFIVASTITTFRQYLFSTLLWIECLVLFVNWVESKKGFKPQPVEPSFEKCQDIVDEQNEILLNRGLKWHLPNEFPHWIELTKDLKRQANEFQINTEGKITFTLKRGRYSKDFYSPEMTGGRISHEEMHEFISQINADLRRPFPRLNPGWFVFFLICDTWIFALVMINDHLLELSSPFMNFVIVAILLVLSIIIATRVGSGYEEKLRVEFAASFEEQINEFNEILRSRGLRWNLPSQFPDSIELCKDYINQEDDSLETSSEDYGKINLNRRFRNNGYAPLVEDESSF